MSRVRVREDKNKNTFLRTLSRALHLLPLLLLTFHFPVTFLLLLGVFPLHGLQALFQGPGLLRGLVGQTAEFRLAGKSVNFFVYAAIDAVGTQGVGFSSILEKETEHSADASGVSNIVDRKKQLYPLIEVAGHPIGTGKIDFSFIANTENKDAVML